MLCIEGAAKNSGEIEKSMQPIPKQPVDTHCDRSSECGQMSKPKYSLNKHIIQFFFATLLVFFLTT